MKPLSSVCYMTYLACIVIEFTGGAVLLEMNTISSGLVKINTKNRDWTRFYECMRNTLTSLCTLHLNETGPSGNYREFQSNGVGCETTVTDFLIPPTFECDFQEKCEDITDKCSSIVCLRPKNKCTLMPGCNGVFNIQWKHESDYLRSSTLSYVCEETVDRKCFVHCYQQAATKLTFSQCNSPYPSTTPTISKNNSNYQSTTPTISKSNSPYPSTTPTISKNNSNYQSTTPTISKNNSSYPSSRPKFSNKTSRYRSSRATSSTAKSSLSKSINTTATVHDDKKHKRDNGKNKEDKLSTETILIAVVICLIVIAILVILCFLSKNVRQKMGRRFSCFTDRTASHCSSGNAKSNTTQGNTNVSYTAENICFDGDTHVYDDCSLTEDFPSWKICASSTAQTEHAKLKKAASDNANKDINEPDTTEYNRLRDQLRIDAVDYNCHFSDISLISPRSSDMSKLNNSDYTLAKDAQTLGKDTLTTSPYFLVELVEPSNEPNFRFNQTDLAQNILLQQIEMITVF
ncbi:probable serine/threonine-protein kinase nek3 [Biomphalaria glabrata]|uniref:Probable serine/threonine-protein kinase nek3 n=1 Tax=Biomphalaria glabrata TaxID=6526 RepID=A0A9W3BPL4_BIOGL|nr:probable serine/threonine-protein kinase nek3 [Biomphalaria glabrata]